MAAGVCAHGWPRLQRVEIRFRMNRYFEEMILTASPVELIRMLYQRAIASVHDARQHLAKKRILERGKSINNAYLILTELSGSLRTEEAPQLAARLKGLYAYIQAKLLEANLHQTDEPLAEALALLTTLAGRLELGSGYRRGSSCRRKESVGRYGEYHRRRACAAGAFSLRSYSGPAFRSPSIDHFRKPDAAALRERFGQFLLSQSKGRLARLIFTGTKPAGVGFAD